MPLSSLVPLAAKPPVVRAKGLARVRRWSLQAMLATLWLLTAPAWADFTSYGNGTVFDNTTHLRWDACVYGKTGPDCTTGTQQTYTWTDALVAVTQANNSNYKGHSNWRLPNRAELDSIVKRDVYPAIDTNYFPYSAVLVPNWTTWTSTNYMGNPNSAYSANFWDGAIDFTAKTTLAGIRLVTGGNRFAPFDSQATGPTLGAVSVTDITGSSAKVTFSIDKIGYYYCALLPAGSPAPTSEQLRRDNLSMGCGNGTLSPNDPHTLWFQNLPSETGYDVYLFAEDLNPMPTPVSGPHSFTTLDTTPPTTVFLLADINSTTLAVINEAGTGYFLTLPASSPAPSVADMLASGTAIAMTTNTAAGMQNHNLAPSTPHVFYFLAKDTAGNTQTSVGSEPFTTPAAGVRSASGTPPGAGLVTASFTGGNSTCAYETTQFPSAAAVGGTPPAGVAFPQGAFGFTTNDCGPGAVLSFTMTYAQPFPQGTRYYKYNGTAWAEYPATISGNQITFTVTDNGEGDTNPAEGFISDPGGPGVPLAAIATQTQAVPTLSEYGLMLLVALMGWLGMRSKKGRRAA